MQEARRPDLSAGFAGHPFRPCIRRAAELRLQVGVEDAVTTIRGRGHSEQAAGEIPGDPNGDSHPPLKTEAAVLHLRPPKVRDTAMPVSIALPDEWQRMTPARGTRIRHGAVRGRSTRNVEGLDAEVVGARVAKSAASRARPALQAECDAWRTRDLGACQVLSRFLDGQFQAARAERTAKEGLLAAAALCEDGKVIRWHLGLGPRERPDAWGAVLPDLPTRHLGTARLVISAGNPGLVRAVKPVFPGGHRQRGPVPTLRNLLATFSKLAATQLTS
jgi:transposase-like protein